MNFDVKAVVGTMLKAAEGPLGKYWKSAKATAESEFTKIAELVTQIGVDRATQTITPQDAADRLDMAKEAARIALDTQIGLSEIAAEDAVNAALSAALGSVSSLVNGYLGFAVL